VFTLLAWIGTCVAFGGVLVKFSASALGGVSADGYYDHIAAAGDSFSWGIINSVDNGSIDCTGAGKGLVAMLVFAFLSTLATLVLFTLRLTSLNLKIGALSNSAFVASVEFALTAVSAFFYFLAVCVWGGACYSKLLGYQYISSVSATGFAFIIFNFLTLLLLALPISYFLHKSAKEGEGQYVSQHDAVPHAEDDTSATAPVIGGSYGGFQNETQSATTNPQV